MMARATRSSAHALIVGVIIFSVYCVVQGCEQREAKPVLKPYVAQVNAKELKLVEAFRANNSPVPHEMAAAVVNRKRPRLLASVAIIESNATPWAVGDAGEVSAWQIIEDDWGPVGETTADHAKKAEDILEKLLKENNGNIRISLEKYNGGPHPGEKSRRYAQKVIETINKVRL